MTKQVIDIGSAYDDPTADPTRDSFDKVNDNFTENYDSIAANLASIVIINNAGFVGTASISSDCDAENLTSVVRIDNSTANTPGTNTGFMFTMFTDNRGIQVLIDRVLVTMYFRVNNTGTWSGTWKTVTAV